ncbi:hypothetical protein EIP91_003262 [Steccherinum ochraceum]|uniref:CUE domain-containing protein n=1 Tax=Steccherinum ochraceum TaxID=92696 RepID=A0A4R0RP95_9APHY|nr:hypothetical protein EIP91_003262 [Steccherinum ochraceum]
MIARWPRALQYDDVLAKKTPLERCKAYADKINELAEFDCGLSDWIMATKYRGSGMRNSHHGDASIVHGSPRAPSSFNFNPQPRHTSHGSMGSEATFPVRSDAYTATDLSMRDIDDVSSTKSPPPLPYPSLANPRISNRSSMLTISSQRYEVPMSSTSSKSSASSFFASFGRKTSVKKERGMTLNPPSPHRVLTKRLPDASRSPPPARPAALASPPPHLPGGPRNAPTRMQRAQTISVSPTPPPAAVPAVASAEMIRRSTQRSTASRRPSLFGGRGSSVLPASSGTLVSDPQFEDQVDKLADLLPHADRRVLAGYLRRSGQDILAIGQYLEDEKNGTLRRD